MGKLRHRGDKQVWLEQALHSIQHVPTQEQLQLWCFWKYLDGDVGFNLFSSLSVFLAVSPCGGGFLSLIQPHVLFILVIS